MKQVPSVQIPLADGTVKSIKIDWATLSAAEEKLGGEENFLEKLSTGKLMAVMSLRRIHAIVWAGLSTSGSALSFEQVGRLLDGTRLTEYAQALSEGFGYFLSGNKPAPAEAPAEDSKILPLDKGQSPG